MEKRQVRDGLGTRPGHLLTPLHPQGNVRGNCKVKETFCPLNNKKLGLKSRCPPSQSQIQEKNKFMRQPQFFLIEQIY